MARATNRPRGAAASQSPAPPVLNIAAAVATEEIEKAQRVYVDKTPRVLTASGPLACVQRELRVDGSLGEFLLASIRINQRDKTESAQRYPIAHTQELINALASVGVTLFELPTAPAAEQPPAETQAPA